MRKLNREEYDIIIKECRDISIKKNADYGCETMTTFGEKGLVVRMNDKMQRLINLVWKDNKPEVALEQAEDTALDMINYAVYLTMALRKKLTVND